MGIIEFASPESANYVRSLNDSAPLFPNQGIVIDFFDQRSTVDPAKNNYNPYLVGMGPAPVQNAQAAAASAMNRLSYADYSKPGTQMGPINQFSAPAFYPGDIPYQQMLPTGPAQFLDYYNYQLGSLSRSANAG